MVYFGAGGEPDMFSGTDAPWHWAILILVAVALFGYKKLPDASRALGRSLRIFKTEIKGMVDDDKVRDGRDGTADPAAEVRPLPQAEVVPPTVTVEKSAPSAPSTGGDQPSAGAQ
jgi:sec-independent protein translocase protein TatA